MSVRKFCARSFVPLPYTDQFAACASAAVHATTATFGTWTVDEATKTLTIRYTATLFPNQAGTESKRVISVTGDELRVSNPMTGSGMESDTVWRRAK
jgi:hypothetical protein